MSTCHNLRHEHARLRQLAASLIPMLLLLCRTVAFAQERILYTFEPATLSATNVADVSGNSLNAQISNTNGGLSQNASGAFGACLRFTGGDTNDGMLLLPAGHVPSGSSPRTIALWFRQNAANGQSKLFGSGAGTAGQTFDVGLEAGGIRIRHFGGNITYGSGNDFLPAGAQAGWHHLAVRVNSNAVTFAQVDVFLDGLKLPVTAVASAGTNQTLNTANSAFGIGNTTVTASGANLSDFDGFLDEFRIYDSPINDGAIAALAVRPADAQALSFYASPGGRVPAGASVSLHWQVTPAASVNIQPGIGNVSSLTTNGVGSVVVNPLTNTIYTLTATGTNGSLVERTVALTIGTNPFPNVILFVLDDFGWADWQQNGSTNGSVFFETPSMNRLAAEGKYFPNGYASSPVCSPTRGAIMSGQSPARSKLTDWITGSGDAGKPVQEADWIKKLPLSDVTIPDALRASGYRTIHVGKWHLGDVGDPEADPLLQGFEVNIGGNHKGNPGGFYFADGSGSFDLPNLGAGSAAPGTYLTDFLTVKANEQIASAATNGIPFFMYFAHYAVHTPLVAPAATVAKYTTKLASPPPGGWQGQTNATYAAMIEHADLSLSHLVQRLHDPNADGNTNDSIAANTLVIFFSDNGGLLSSTSNRPLRTGKGYGYEGGVREPLIFWWPGCIQPNTIAEPAICYDFFPTILGAAQLPADPGYGPLLDGQDLTPLLFGTGGFERQRPLVFHYPHYSPQGGKPCSATRLGDWKLLHFYENNTYELYNLGNDIGESQNLILAETNRTATMSRTLIRMLEALDANYPSTLANAPLRPTPKVAPGTDADGDKLLDTTEDANGDGLLGGNETDPDDSDTDNDTTPDGAEAAIGTNPRNPASALTTRITQPNPPQVTLAWPSLPGATFTLETKTNATDAWNIQSSGIAADGGTNTTRNFTPNAASQLYRVRLEGF